MEKNLQFKTEEALKKRKTEQSDAAAPQKVDAASIQRAVQSPSAQTLTPDVIHALQSSHGNQFVSRLVQRARGGGLVVQAASLTVTPANDQYEQEADNVAKSVVSQINAPDVQRQGDEDELAMQRIQREGEEDDELAMKRIQREGEEDDELAMQRIQREGEEDELAMQRIQRAVGDDPLGGQTVSDDIEQRIESVRGSGAPLDHGVQQQMEGAFNADFSGVRVHSDSTSDSLNRSVQAKAFTTGQDIFFRSGTYQPGSSSGKELLAHELTHVVQQNGATVQRQNKDENA